MKVRAAVYYAVSVCLLTLFGCEVCPFLESLGRHTLAGVLIGFFCLGWLLRTPLERRWIQGKPLLSQPPRQFALELGVFVGVGVSLTLFDRLYFGYPIGSGARVLLGCLTIGLFCATDQALARERKILSALSYEGVTLDPGARTFSMTRRFVALTLSLLTLVAADLLLLALRDLQQLSERSSVGAATTELVLESGLALAFLFPLTVNLILSYAQNLRRFLQNQRTALRRVAEGDFEVKVPIASRDEFAEIARDTNSMIDGLRERERVRDLFGKLVSPSVGKRLLSEKNLRLGGSRRQVVVLFSDVRNFTARTEAASPEVLIEDLNTYFSRMVEVVHAHAGIVDKFIGDGLMAIFGLEDPAGASSSAVRAAVAMLEALGDLNARMSAPMAIGIGIHAGEVVAGTVGAPTRLEFTFIGDPVNVAARLEGLTKELGAQLVISSAVHEGLAEDAARLAWEPRGAQAVKGRAGSVEVYALCSKTASAEPDAA